MAFGQQQIRRFCFLRGKKKKKKQPAPPSSSSGDDDNNNELPLSLWITNIFPYLDRNSQNRLCMASREVYYAHKESLLHVVTTEQWPCGTIRVPKRRIVLAAAFSPDGSELAFVTSNSKTVTIYHRSYGFDQHLCGHKGQCSDVSYAPPSGNFLVSCSRVDGSVRLWRKEVGQNEAESKDQTKKKQKQYYVNYRILNVKVFGTLYTCVSPNGRDVASYGDDGKIYVSDAEDGGKLVASTFWRSRLFIDCFRSVAFSGENDWIVAHTFNNQTVRLWNYRAQTTMELEDNDATRMVDYAAYITSLHFVSMNPVGDDASSSNEGPREYLAVGCRVAMVKLWDLSDYSCVLKIHLGTGWSSVNHLVFNDQGTHMACTGGGSSLRLFSLVSEGNSVGRVENHKDCIKTLAFSPDGKTLVSGSVDRTLKLWTVHQTSPSKKHTIECSTTY